MDWAGVGTGLRPVSSLGLDKPCIIGEFAKADASYGLDDTTVYSARWYLDSIRAQGYGGALGWSLDATDAASNWTRFQPVFTNWARWQQIRPNDF